MPNALMMNGTPAAPMAQPQPQQQGMAAQPSMQAQPAGPSPALPQQQQPPLTHQQATAGLRHFHAIAQELEVLMKNPQLGRTDIRSAIIDGTTKLVASRIITPSDAVMQLGQVPDDPQLQRKWVQQHFTQTMLAENAILDQHRATTPGTGDWAAEAQAQGGHPDDHIEIMKGVRARYQGGGHA